MDKNLRAQALKMAIDSLNTQTPTTKEIFDLADQYLRYILEEKTPIPNSEKKIHTEFEISQSQRCRENMIYFVNTFVQIQHPLQGGIPFPLYDFQRHTLKQFETHRFNIMNSARQMGTTTLMCSFILWYALFNTDKTIVTISNRMANSMELANRIRFAYEHLPEYLQVGIVRYSKTEIEFDNGSKILFKAASPHVCRGLSCDLICIDSAAYISHKIGYEMWHSLMPILSTGGRVIIASTPGDTQGLFYDLWHKDNNGFNKIFLPWHVHPERDEHFAKRYKDVLGDEHFAREFECKFVSKR